MKFDKLLLIKALIALGSVFSMSLSLNAAEQFQFNYGLLGFKLQIADVELFVEQGVINDRLNFYLKRISPEKQEKLRSFLQQSYAVDPVLAYRFGKTSVGEKLLQRLGDIAQIPEDINGFYALRAAIVNTAVAPENFNFINFAKRFPVNIQLNLAEVVRLTKQISRSEAATRKFINVLQESEPNSYGAEKVKEAGDLAKLGSFSVAKRTIKFEDQKRDRQIVTDLYIPRLNSWQQNNNSVSTSQIPVIAVSNGLGARPSRFAELANYLASYGFAVAIIDHPGSNYDRQQEFIKGLHQENFEAADYLDRPLDVSFVLDRLAELNHEQFASRLNLEQVGVFGYSIGGATALSLTGAKIDFERLRRSCQETLDLTNISTLYQCRALELENLEAVDKLFSLKDERIKAAFLFVPFGNSLFEQSQLAEIRTPMLWQVVDKDFLTSLTQEQLPLYKALEQSDRYLVISENLPHSTAILAKSRSQAQKNQLRVGRKYQNVLSKLFFQHYLQSPRDFSADLNLDLLKSIEEKPYSLYLRHDNPALENEQD